MGIPAEYVRVTAVLCAVAALASVLLGSTEKLGSPIVVGSAAVAVPFAPDIAFPSVGCLVAITRMKPSPSSGPSRGP